MDDKIRRGLRMEKLKKAAQTIADYAGAPTVNAVFLAQLGQTAEMAGLWDFMVAKGLCTEEQRQNAIDAGYKTLVERVNRQRGELQIASLVKGEYTQ